MQPSSLFVSGLVLVCAFGCRGNDASSKEANDKTPMTKRAPTLIPPQSASKSTNTAGVARPPRRTPFPAPMFGFPGMGEMRQFPGGPSSSGPADLTVSDSYTSKSGEKIKIEGVCKVTEDSIACWDPGGKPHLGLEDVIRKTLSTQFNNSGLNLRYGRKNRIIVADVTRDSHPQPISLSLANMGDDPSSYSNFSIMNQRAVSPGSARLEAVVSYSAPGQSLGKLRIRETQIQGAQLRLEPKERASGKIGDGEIRIVSLGKAERDAFFGSFPRNRWVYRLRYDHQGDRHYKLDCQITDIHGALLPMIDSSGHPIAFRPPGGSFFGGGPNRFQPSPNAPFGRDRGIRPVEIFLRISRQNEMELVTNVDPSKTPRLQFMETYTRFIDISNVLLDPK